MLQGIQQSLYLSQKIVSGVREIISFGKKHKGYDLKNTEEEEKIKMSEHRNPATRVYTNHSKGKGRALGIIPTVAAL